MRTALIIGVISGIMGLLISFLLNYFLIPMPQTVFANGLSGLMSGFMGGFIGLLMYLKKSTAPEK